MRLLKKPAENNMYTCLDIHAGYGLPFSCANDKIALKSFEYYCITDEEGKMNAQYLELYKCGTFNRDTGEYKNHKMILLGKGSKYVQKRIQQKNQNVATNGQ